MAHTLAGMLQSIDPAHIAAAQERLTESEVADLVNHAHAETRRRLVNHDDTEDACQVAAFYALGMAGDPDHAANSLHSLARVTGYRVALVTKEGNEQQNNNESASGLAEDLATYEVEPAARIQLASPPRPDGSALPPSLSQRAALALATLARTRPDLADLVALATYLDPEDGRAWRTGRPSAAPMLALYGLNNTGRNRAAMAQRIALAFHALAEHAEAHDHHRSAGTNLRPRHGWTGQPWSRRTPAAPTHRNRCTPEAAALAWALTGNDIGGTWSRTTTTGKPGKTDAERREEPTAYGKPRTIPTSGPASLPLTETPVPVVPLAHQPLRVTLSTGERIPLPDTAEHRAYVLGVLALPAWRKRTEKGADATQRERTEADALALEAATDATGRSATAVPGVTPGILTGAGTLAGMGSPFRAPTPRKRKRDGAIGSSMTRA